MSPCPLTVIKCERSGYTGRVNEIPYVAKEVPLNGVMVRTFPCPLRSKKRPEVDPPSPWWWAVTEPFVALRADEGLRLLGLNDEQIAHLIKRAKEWDEIPAVEKTGDNPFGNPPVMCEHCRNDVRWPDRESCETCGGFTCGCVCK